jgi:hypothetical protein
MFDKIFDKIIDWELKFFTICLLQFWIIKLIKYIYVLNIVDLILFFIQIMYINIIYSFTFHLKIIKIKYMYRLWFYFNIWLYVDI